MDRANGLQVVLGAGGGTGRAIVDELVRQGRQVRAVGRSDIADLPAGVEQVRADLYDPADAARAVAGASVVYHAAQPPYAEWDGNFERLNASVGDAAGAAGARLVFADNLYMYGPGGSPMTETTPQRATDRKGAQRIRLAADLLARHERGDLEVAIGRSSDYFGPHGVNTGAGERVFGAMVEGKAAAARRVRSTRITRSATCPTSPARWSILGDRDEAAGRAWHLPVMDPITVRAFLERAFAVAGMPVEDPRGRPARAQGRRACSCRWRARSAWCCTSGREPFVSDWSAFETAFGPFERTPLDEAIATTLDWWRERAGGQGRREAAEGRHA